MQKERETNSCKSSSYRSTLPTPPNKGLSGKGGHSVWREIGFAHVRFHLTFALSPEGIQKARLMLAQLVGVRPRAKDGYMPCPKRAPAAVYRRNPLQRQATIVMQALGEETAAKDLQVGPMDKEMI